MTLEQTTWKARAAAYESKQAVISASLTDDLIEMEEAMKAGKDLTAKSSPTTLSAVSSPRGNRHLLAI